MEKEWYQRIRYLVCAAILAALLLPNGAAAVQTGGAAAVEEPEEKYIALTFDDGPRPDTTAALLEGLRQRGVHATFFLIGAQITGNEELIRQMAKDGHQIGNHTFTHCKLKGSSREDIIQEINKTEVLLHNILGPGEFWLRPPYGLIDEKEKKLIKTPMVYWSVDPEDWKLLDTPKVVEHVCSHAKNGDIILLHDFYPTSVEAALEIVDRLQAGGYWFVTVEELLALNGTQPRAGHLYRNGKEEL